MNTFENTKTEINQFIESPRFKDIFKGHNEVVKSIINTIFSDIEILQNETGDTLKTDITQVSKLIDIIMYNSVESCLSDQECKDLKNISQLVFNYNTNSINDIAIMRRTTFLNNFLGGFITFRDSIQLFKSLSEKLQKFTDFNPPSFQLSQHYIDSIYGEPISDKDKDKCGD